MVFSLNKKFLVVLDGCGSSHLVNLFPISRGILIVFRYALFMLNTLKSLMPLGNFRLINATLTG